MKLLLLALSLCLVPVPALAHKVIAAVFPSGQSIEGEIGFSDGSMARNQTVTVTDASGRVLGEVVTDDTGFFTFVPVEPVDHVFTANLGAGHLAQATMAAADVARILGQQAVAAPAVSAPAEAAPPQASGIDREAVAEMLRNELRPLRQEISAYREKNDLQTILGGIGYIVGLFGLAFYLAARRRVGGN